MSLIFSKYLPLNIPSDFIVAEVLNVLHLPYLACSHAQFNSGRFSHILKKRNYNKQFFIDRINILPEFLEDSPLFIVFDTLPFNMLETYFQTIQRRMFNKTRAVHIIIPYVCCVETLDHFSGIKATNVSLIENSDVAYLSFTYIHEGVANA